MLTTLPLSACFDAGGSSASETEGASSGDDSTTGDDPTTTNTTPGVTTTDPSTTTDPLTTTDPDTTAADSGTTVAGPECGDGTVDDGEACDDGNTDADDGCDAMCAVEDGWDCDGADPTTCASVCGDGLTVGDEECDDNNAIDTDECTNLCLNAVCGDNIIWEGMETCDDGNTDPLDGCSDTCQTEGLGQACDDAVPPNCFPAAFLAQGSNAVAGNLWAMSLDGATTVDLGPLGVPITAMAFHPDGTLYAITSTQFSSPDGTAELGTIDTETAIYTPIALIGAGADSHPSMPDMTFMGDQLVGWTESGDDIALIDIATAAVTVVSSPQNSLNTALSYDPLSDELFLAPENSSGTLFTVDDVGAVVAGPTLGGVNGAVKGMAFGNGVLYAMDTSTGADALGDFVTYDTATGAMTVLGVLPAGGLDALAVYDSSNVAAP